MKKIVTSSDKVVSNDSFEYTEGHLAYTSDASDSDEQIMAFRQSYELDGTKNRLSVFAGYIAKCITVFTFVISFVFCLSQSYDLRPDHLPLILLAALSCIAMASFTFGTKGKVVGVFFLLASFFVYFKLCFSGDTLRSLRNFYYHLSGLLSQKGYNFLPIMTKEGDFSVSEADYSAFSTEVSAILVLVFMFVCVFSLMGKRIRIVYFSTLCVLYFSFSFFIGFYPSALAFAILCCSLVAIYFMLVYERSLVLNKQKISSDSFDTQKCKIFKIDSYILRSVCSYFISFVLIYTLSKGLDVWTDFIYISLSTALITLVFVFLHFGSYGGMEERGKYYRSIKATSSLLIFLSILALFTNIVFFSDIAEDLNYVVSQIYHKALRTTDAFSEASRNGLFSLDHLDSIRSGDNYASLSLRIVSLIQLLIVALVSYSVLGRRIRLSLLISLTAFSLISTIVLRPHFSLSLILLFIVLLSVSFVFLFIYRNKVCSEKKRIKKEKKGSHKAKKKPVTLEIHAKQGFTGLISLTLSFLFVFLLISPSKLTPVPKVNAIDDQFRTVRTLIQSYIGFGSFNVGSYDSGSFGSGKVSDDPVVFQNVEKIEIVSSQKNNIYLRGWIGKEYNNGKWSNADSVDSIRFRQRFGTDFIPDSLYVDFMEFVDLVSSKGDADLSTRFNGKYTYLNSGSNVLFLPSFTRFSSIYMYEDTIVKYLSDSSYYLSKPDGVNDPFFPSYYADSFLPDYSEKGFISNFENLLAEYIRLKDQLIQHGKEQTIIKLQMDNSENNVLLRSLVYSKEGLAFIDKIYDNVLRSVEYEKYVYEEYVGLSSKISQSSRMKELFDAVTAEGDSRLKKIMLIVNYFKNNFEYTTEPRRGDPKGGDYIEGFIFDTQEGYCSHFATAMTNLLRVGGIPARYVEGFCVDPANAKRVRESGKNVYKYSVYDNNAHAWVEAYIDGLGWMLFECTAGYGYYADLAGASTVLPPMTWEDDPMYNDDPTTEPPLTDDGVINETETVPPAIHDNEEWDKGYAFIVLFGIVFFSGIVLFIRPRITRIRRKRRFASSGSYAMMSYLERLFKHFDIDTSSYSDITELSSRVYAALEKYSDESYVSFKEKGIQKMLDMLQRSEFSESRIPVSEKKLISAYIFRISDCIYRKSNLFEKIKDRYILNLI